MLASFNARCVTVENKPTQVTTHLHIHTSYQYSNNFLNRYYYLIVLFNIAFTITYNRYQPPYRDSSKYRRKYSVSLLIKSSHGNCISIISESSKETHQRRKVRLENSFHKLAVGNPLSLRNESGLGIKIVTLIYGLHNV